MWLKGCLENYQKTGYLRFIFSNTKQVRLPERDVSFMKIAFFRHFHLSFFPPLQNAGKFNRVREKSVTASAQVGAVLHTGEV